MPFVWDPNLDQDQKEKESSNLSISGASPTTDSEGGQSGGQKSPQTSQNTGSGFQNLDKYLQTNPANQFAQQVTGKVQGQIDQAKQGQDQASESFTNKVQQANSDAPTQSDINSAIANPTSVDPSKYQSWENLSYAGPHSLAEDSDDYNKFWSGQDQAKTQANLLGTESGRFSLLDNYFGKPTYNFGQKSLDNLLIQQGGVGDQTKSLQDQAAQLQTQGMTQQGKLQDLASQKVGSLQDLKGYARSAIGIDDSGNLLTGTNSDGTQNYQGAIGSAYGDIQRSVADLNKQRSAQTLQEKTALNSGQLTAQDLAALGISNSGQTLGTNLSQYVTPGAALTNEQGATDDQRARLSALASLAGINQTLLGAKSDPGAAYNIDYAKGAQGITAAQGNIMDAYNKAYGDIQNYYQPQVSGGSNPIAFNHTNQITKANDIAGIAQQIQNAQQIEARGGRIGQDQQILLNLGKQLAQYGLNNYVPVSKNSNRQGNGVMNNVQTNNKQRMG